MSSQAILERNRKVVDNLGDIFASSGVYLFDYRGLTVAEMEGLRRKVKKLKADVRVIKNRLAIKYFEKEKQNVGRDIFKGPMAVAYANENFTEVAKIITEFDKEKKISLKFGFIEKQFVQKEKVQEVAKLPAKEQLLAMLVGSISMPLKKFGMALSAPLTNMLILIKNLREKKEKEDKQNG